LRSLAVGLLALPLAALAQSRCTVAAFVPDTLVNAAASPADLAADDPLARAIRLIGEGRSSEARAMLRQVFEAAMSQSRERLALAWSLAALADVTQGEMDAARDEVSRTR